MALNYNPDVLLCLANLSNDEVFTPPNVANAMLDLLPETLWSDPNATFLDPCCKSGVFLREIAKRLIKGLEPVIPDLQQRLDHIFHQQLFGIAITELTALLSRRSVYCTKYANSKWSVSHFDTPEGNIAFPRVQHTWDGNRCRYCGASKEVFGERKETHAYALIHNINPEKLFNMKFDVIIGNPPYQLSDGGGMGSSAMPIYQKFVDKAKKLRPRFLTMIMPSRWFSGGRGLNEFRDEMLHDRSLRVLHDYPDASDCFPGVEIKGGVCYFLWDKNNQGDCNISSHSGAKVVSTSIRPLLEKGMDTFIRYNEMISILKKVQKLSEKSFSEIISANDPFGYDVRVTDSYKRVKPSYSLTPLNEGVKFFYNGWRKEGVGYVKRENIRKGHHLIDKWKVLVAKAWGAGNMQTDWVNPFIVDAPSVCTETYLVIGPFTSKSEAENAISYTQTKFFHMMVSMLKITQNTMQKAYSCVPMQDFSKPWTDEELYKKYGLTDEEIAFIESMIRPMEVNLNV
ncbi:MAG: Eco57I restriction-modification methylase domain-containing protein [Kiritimatiellae bacterium]|nr:Eco57I restriction-modification methylase domain-containing protein [Kiritimatiellia bacterium]